MEREEEDKEEEEKGEKEKGNGHACAAAAAAAAAAATTSENEATVATGARYFREEDIDEFRECFYLFARNGQIRTLDELTIIMRSLGLSPTIAELNKYLKDKGGKMSFADFLEAMHLQTRAEDLPKEVIEAFQAADTAHTGTIPARQLAHMLLHWGEKLSNKEVEQIFREANVSINGNVKYEDFVKIACAPVPDYY
ncbi:hypothetical protein HZH68_006643 [Vespula germanica]|uniref:EF-hand domain-containing protein n=1 Tax=Vespula germanica TaxID=30212 RepID=A0A834NDA4_VESGE|nr:hypothetical protein HZH68_006643 [Vespula germanica]